MCVCVQHSHQPHPVLGSAVVAMAAADWTTWFVGSEIAAKQKWGMFSVPAVPDEEREREN